MSEEAVERAIQALINAELVDPPGAELHANAVRRAINASGLSIAVQQSLLEQLSKQQYRRTPIN